MPITSGPDGNPQLEIGEDLLFAARDVRRTSTGIHASVGFFDRQNGKFNLLASNIFNVGRSQDQSKLCRDGFRRMSGILRETYPVETLEVELVYFCLWMETEWERQRFEITSYTHTEAPPPLVFALEPYIQDGGGTILFAPRESAKSYLAMCFGAIIANGLDGLWISQRRPVIYVNLERDPVSMRRRDYHVAQTLGLAETGIQWLHARGHGMESVARQVEKLSTPDSVVIYDSISRMGVGALNEDQTANRSMDLANWSSRTWLAIGHTARGDESHVFGSTHFENAADVIVKVVKEAKLDGTIGLLLHIVKANDQRKPRPEILALEFGEHGLSGIRKGLDREFTKLLASSAESGKPRMQQLIDYIQMIGPCSATEAAEGTGIDRSNISTWFNGSGLFKVHEKRGKEVVYVLRESTGT
jgi:hypothetical protein